MNQLIGAVFRLPLDVLVFGIEGALRGVQEFQSVYNQQLQMEVSVAKPYSPHQSGCQENFQRECVESGRAWHRCGCDCGRCSCQAFDKKPLTEIRTYEPPVNENGRSNPLKTPDYEENVMSNMKCEGVQLVSYKISFVKEDLEAVLLPDGQEIVDDGNDCGTSLEVWKTAEFVQVLTREPRRRPGKWIENQYPPADSGHRVNEHNQPDANGLYYNGMPEEDKKYLRFYYDVLASYEREATNYAEEQAAALKSINQTLKTMKEGIG